ncbi:MAG: hypothetical protein JWP76_5535 [Dactylosporangium sp.]|jgi:hypothetical protein|nr:hypothetical protein [Dactylosporangium sp.]
MNTLTLLADNLAQNNFGDTMTGGLAGPMGLFVIVVLVIGTVLLIRNMNSRLRRLPDHFSSTDTPGAGAGTGVGGSAAGASGAIPAAAEPQGDERSQP